MWFKVQYGTPTSNLWPLKDQKSQCREKLRKQAQFWKSRPSFSWYETNKKGTSRLHITEAYSVKHNF